MARLYRFRQDKGGIGVAFSDHPIEKEDRAFLLSGEDDVYALLQTALAEGKAPKTLVKERLTAERVSLEQLQIEKRFLLPIEHHDPARCIVTGTGLTHSGSADIRNDMNSHDTNLSDSMRLYLKGKEDGKPTAETIGTQPEWFYKGTGHCLLPHGAPILTPNYSLTAGEEPEVGGVYLIDDKGDPHRAGYVLGNDFSDHQLEGQNYLFVAVSKLRPCPLAPALFLGELPGSV
ncbi:MAG: GguC protein, partial [Pseudomonadota bacterium]